MSAASADPRERVYRFLLGWLAPDRDPEIRAVGLNQALGPEQSTPLSTRSVRRHASPDDREKAAHDLADEIVSEAETWAVMVPKAQVIFTVAVFRSEDPSDPPITHHPFIIVRTGDFARQDGDLSDPLSMAGMLARNATDQVRIAAGNQQETIEGVRAENAYLRQQIALRDEKHFAYLLERERLLDGKADREFRLEREKFYLSLQEQGAGLLVQWLASKIGGGGDGPKVTVTAEQIVRFARCLTPEQSQLARPLLDGLLAVMTPEQKAELVKLHKMAAAGQLPAVVTNGVAPAAPRSEAS